MKLDIPSGRTYNEEDIHLLEMMNYFGSVKYSEDGFILKSGIRSNVYVVMRGDVTDNPNLGVALGHKLAETVVANHQDGDKAPCLIGIPTAATGLAAAASLVAEMETVRSPAGPISYRVMREAEKSHGAGATNWVNGAYDSDHTFWLVDNVVTDCGSKIEARDKLIQSGYPGFEMPSLIAVDRQQGGIERMKNAGFKRIVVVYNLLDITYAMGELDLWPKAAVKSVEEEIAAHQVT